MTREEAIKVLSNRDGHGIPSGYNGGYAEAIEVAIEALKADPYIEFCEWVADTVLYEDFEDKWTLGAFAEVACRKLHKIGFIRKDGEYWAKDEVEE